MVALKLRLDVDGQEGLAGKYLRTGTLEVVVDEFHLVNAASS